MRAARAFASAAKAAAGAGEKTVPWDMTSGMKSIVEMGPAFLLVIGGATTLFLGIPKLYGSKLPRTMEADWKKAEMMKMHAKERQGAPDEPIAMHPFTNKISPKDYLYPPEHYRRAVETED